MDTLKVGVIEEDEILLRGLIATLDLDTSLEVVPVSSRRMPHGLDVAVVSAAALRRVRLACPTVVLSEDHRQPVPNGNNVIGILPREGLTAEKLLLAVRAAAVGLRVEAEGGPENRSPHSTPAAWRCCARWPKGPARGSSRTGSDTQNARSRRWFTTSNNGWGPRTERRRSPRRSAAE